MTTTNTNTPFPAEDEFSGADLECAIRHYVQTYADWRGSHKAMERFGVSRQTLWRFLERGHLGRALPKAVLDSVGDSVEAVDAATWAVVASERITANFNRAARNRRPAGPALRRGQEDALLQLCAAPLTTVSELARFNREPPTTLRGRLDRLAELGLADSVSHSLAALGPKPQRRYFPKKEGIHAAAALESGIRSFLADRPVSRQWFRLLTERLDAVAVLSHVAALIADADPEGDPVRVDHYRQGPYDLLVTLSQGRSVGILRQGPTLPSAHLRYRLRTVENLPVSERPTVTLVITGSDQATRRAVRTLGHPVEHESFFVSTEGEQLAGDHRFTAWQQCGHGMGVQVKIAPHLSLENIVASIGWLVDKYASVRRDRTPPHRRQPEPDPYSLYPEHLRAALPDPTEQVKSSLAVQLSRAEKDALDLLAAWPLCTTDQLMGLMGGVTRRRANQVLRSLTQLSLVHSESQRHVLADEGLRYLARRDRAAVRIALGRWSARKRRRSRDSAPVIAGTSLRSLDSQLDHQDAINTVVAALSAEAARSKDHHLLELLPTSRSSIGYRYQGQDYVIHPDAAFWLSYQGDWRPYFLEFERRAVTPRRVRERLKNYPRYFASGWAGVDHAGQLPLVLFVFETHDAEESFLRAAGAHRLPICTSNLEMIADLGVLREAWRWPPPNAPDRLPLHRLGEGYKIVPSRSRHFL
ncbi:MAG: replication-relaxation family protein [Chloroflexi bacterium]|nr:replication-relaxation family protein [Chloroflexota bacterium]